MNVEIKMISFDSFPQLVIRRNTRKSAPAILLQRLRTQVNAEKMMRSGNLWESANTVQLECKY